MRITNSSRRIFQCRDEETITVKIASTPNTRFGVVYELDGEVGRVNEGEPLVFDLDEAAANPTTLTLTFSFTSTDDGAYSIRITGDANGDTFRTAYPQAHVPVVVDQFTFNI
ncbi:MAG TPA: hypothetical protein VKA70_14905 [Blastocatellia bacterium]|nr:hypothetical protein [Blastocatellia bacterium]